MSKVLSSLLVMILAVSAQAAGTMRITEYMYNGSGTGSIGEFAEFTNVGDAAVDLTGWSFDDSSRAPGSQSLSAFGTVAPGESVILTDITTAAAFRTEWSLPGTVKVIGANGNNLGRADEINLYDSANTLIDRLLYDDQTIANSPRANKISAWTEPANLGLNDITKWHLSTLADAGTKTSGLGDVGSPGSYVVPEPLTMILLGGGWVCLARRRPRA